MFYLYIASLVASIVGVGQALIGLALTIVCYGAVNAVLSRYAIRTGFSVELLSRVIFGKVGSALATVVFAATALYYGVFEGSIIAVTLQAWTAQSFGWSLDIDVWYLIVVAYSTPLVFGAVRNWLDRVNGVLLPFYLVGLAVAVIVTAVKGEPAGFGGFGAGTSIPVSGGGPGWLMAFAIYMGVWVLMMYTVDFARLGKPADSDYHARVTFGGVFYLIAFGMNGLAGIFLAHALRDVTGGQITEGGVAVAMTSVMGIFAVLLVWVSQTRINTANYYLASVNLEVFARKVLRIKAPRIVWVIVGSALMYLMMLTDVFGYILKALSWQGVLITGWVGIALVHIALDHRDRVEPDDVEAESDDISAAWWPSVTAWVASSVFGIGIVQLAPAWGVTWGPIGTFVIAALLYAILRTVSGEKNSSDGRPADPRARQVSTPTG
jgi:purine-cytosine permease-like protein